MDPSMTDVRTSCSNACRQCVLAGAKGERKQELHRASLLHSLHSQNRYALICNGTCADAGTRSIASSAIPGWQLAD